MSPPVEAVGGVAAVVCEEGWSEVVACAVSASFVAGVVE